MEEDLENIIYIKYKGEEINCHKDDVKNLIRWKGILKKRKHADVICSESNFGCSSAVSCRKCPFCFNYYITTQSNKKEAIQKLYDTYCNVTIIGNIISKFKTVKLFN